jgi:hypothetical protein
MQSFRRESGFVSTGLTISTLWHLLGFQTDPLSIG